MAAAAVLTHLEANARPREYLHALAGFGVDQDDGVAVAPAQGELVDAQHLQGRSGRQRDADEAQEDILLELLNTTPVMRDGVHDQFSSPGDAQAWQQTHGGCGSEDERENLILARDALQEVIRGERAPGALSELVTGTSYRPVVDEDGIAWDLDVPEGRRLVVLAVLTWGDLQERKPGRLRPCAGHQSAAGRTACCCRPVC